jgi:hypothetical protein
LWFGVVRVGTGFHPYGSSLDGIKKTGSKARTEEIHKNRKSLRNLKRFRLFCGFSRLARAQAKKKKNN